MKKGAARMATAAIRRLWRSEAKQQSGWVETIDGDVLVVDLGPTRVRARRARSCFTAPRAGDLVLIVTTSVDQAYVLAVLESAATDARLELSSDVEMVVDGRLRMVASNGIELVSPKATTITSSELHVETGLARFAFDAISAIGASFRAEVSRVQTVAESIETMVDRIVQLAKNSRRVVTGLDEVRAEQIDHRADATLTLRAKHALVTGDALTKIDGDQVHIG